MASKFRQSDEKKVCRSCKSELVAGLNFRPLNAKYQNWICKTCKSGYDTNLLDRKPARFVRGNLKKYGISLERYEQMYQEQGGKCAICKIDAPLHSRDRSRLYVDHCHKTGNVRGLLCKNCNAGLGQFKDSIEIIKASIDYLGHW